MNAGPAAQQAHHRALSTPGNPPAATGSVSVVMATYNGSRFLREQLASLAAQSVLPFELIVADDGSTDGTPELVADFATTAPFRVVLVRNAERLGYGENFLRATKLTSGDLVAFCDQDDVWRADKLAVAERTLADTGAGMFVHAAYLVDENRRRLGTFTQRIGRPMCHEPLSLPPWSVFYGLSMVFRRELLALVDASRRGRHTFDRDRTLSHDLWLYFLATSLGRVAATPIPLVDYRQHGANQTPHLVGGGLQRWTSSLGKPVDLKLPRNEIARDRAGLLVELSRTHADADVRGAAERAARYWTRIAGFEDLRFRLYAAERPSGRAAAGARLVLRGGYRTFRRGGLGPRLALKDVLAGILQARTPRRRPR